ncbi:hypothetical protein [Holdemania massiliensis]|uniref:hypothetical protein n=1 Tax=Holdemania massiliensis TaxID=1468449 RepID=UPI001F060ED1|nr:hypothetical protein [Holdemania massiliensis]MCH1941302.1 hypothetical protein [Holdemania massiliensis]
MKRSVLPFLFFCMFILNAGCGSQPKNVALASDYTVKQETEISINNDGFPISISSLLDRFKSYSFYEMLNVETIDADQLGSLSISDSTLYIIEGQAEAREERILDTDYHIYYYDQLMIIYYGENQDILQALNEQLGAN